MRHSLLMLSLAAALAVTAGCKREAAPAGDSAECAAQSAAAAKVIDEHSYAEPNKVKVTDLALDLKVDFDKKEIDGSATLALDWLDKTATQLVLDTRDLTISKVVGERSDGKWDGPQVRAGRGRQGAGQQAHHRDAAAQCARAHHLPTAPERVRPAVADAGDDRRARRRPSCSASRSRSTRAPGCRCRTPRACASPTPRT